MENFQGNEFLLIAEIPISVSSIFTFLSHSMNEYVFSGRLKTKVKNIDNDNQQSQLASFYNDPKYRWAVL